MFFGDPYKFAIQCEVIPDWNDDYFWINGVFNIYIDGKPILDEIYTSELRFNLANFTDDILSSMNAVTDTDTDTDTDKVDISLINKNFIFPISSSEMEDLSVFVYFYFSKGNDYILLNNRGKECKFKYDKKYIMRILFSIVDWKKSCGLFMK